MKKVLFLTSTKTVFESEGHSPPQNITVAEKQVLTLTLKLVLWCAFAMGGGRGGESSNSERGQGGPLEPLGTRQNEEGKSSVLSLRINVTTPLLLTPFLMGKHPMGVSGPAWQESGPEVASRQGRMHSCVFSSAASAFAFAGFHEAAAAIEARIAASLTDSLWSPL